MYGHKVQETFRTPYRYDQKTTSPYHTTVKMPRLENKEMILKATKKFWTRGVAQI
jgi:hypothetical protein